MPEEYQGMTANVYCNDCEKDGLSKWHFLYNKCHLCKGFNTQINETFDAKHEKSVNFYQELKEYEEKEQSYSQIESESQELFEVDSNSLPQGDNEQE